MFNVFWRILDKLEEGCAQRDHIIGLLEAQTRLLRMLVERDEVVFEADEEAFEGKALTA